MTRSESKSRVLFVCWGNTCRSLMAEHIARSRFGEYVEPLSVGIDPGTIGSTENAIWTLKRLMEIDASGHQPRKVSSEAIEQADHIVAMDKKVAAALKARFPDLPSDRVEQWKVSDPYGGDLTAYERCAMEILERLSRFARTSVARPEGKR